MKGGDSPGYRDLISCLEWPDRYLQLLSTTVPDPLILSLPSFQQSLASKARRTFENEKSKLTIR